MKHMDLRDCKLVDTTKLCPVCNTMLQFLESNIRNDDYPGYYICPNINCYFMGCENVHQVKTIYSQLQKLGIQLLDFQVSTILGPAPLKVIFIENSFGYDGLTNWTWDFGDGNSIQSPINTTEYTYTIPGIYSVTMQVFVPAKGNQSVVKSNLIIVQ